MYRYRALNIFTMVLTYVNYSTGITVIQIFIFCVASKYSTCHVHMLTSQYVCHGKG
jgi:hypothetical protein